MVSLGMNRCLWQRLGSGMIVLMTILSGSLAAEASQGVDVVDPMQATDATLPTLLPIERDDRLAQFFPSIPDDRRLISVIGNGQASAPADYAGIQMVFGAGDLYSTPETPTPPAPLQDSDLQPLVEALTALNIPADNIEVYLSASPGFPPETAVSPRLQVRLDNPTHSSIQRVIEAVRQIDQENNRFNLQQFGVWYSLNDCRPLEEAARRSAMEDVQTKSQSIAAAAGLELGELVALSGGDVYPPLYGGYACPSSPTSYLDPYSVPPPYTPFIPVEVRLTGTMTAVYELAD